MITTTDAKRWDAAMRNMVRHYGSWESAHEVCKRAQEENTVGYSHYHWNQMMYAFERSRTVA